MRNEVDDSVGVKEEEENWAGKINATNNLVKELDKKFTEKFQSIDEKLDLLLRHNNISKY